MKYDISVKSHLWSVTGNIFSVSLSFYSAPVGPPKEDRKAKALRILKLFYSSERLKPHLEALLAAK